MVQKDWSDSHYGPATCREWIGDDSFISCANLEQIRALLTYCQRGERFCDGFRSGVIEEGRIELILDRLNIINEHLKTSCRIVVWNCAMALHNKVDSLMSLNPDVAIIPESAKPEIVREKNPRFKFNDAAWVGKKAGRGKHKGLGVYSFNGYQLSQHYSYDPSYEYLIPLEVSGPLAFNLVGVWAIHHSKTIPTEIRNSLVLSGLKHYSRFLISSPSIVAGDFNNNVIWDATNKHNKFCLVRDELQDLGMTSSYHEKHSVHYGMEPDPTIYWMKDRSSTYHIDYCFIPRDWQSRLAQVSVGTHDDWIKSSDHVPMVVEIGVAK